MRNPSQLWSADLDQSWLWSDRIESRTGGVRPTWVLHWGYQTVFNRALVVPDRLESSTGVTTSVAHWRCQTHFGHALAVLWLTILTAEVVVIIGIKYFSLKYMYVILLIGVYAFFSKKILVWNKKKVFSSTQLSILRLWPGLWYSSSKIGKCSSKNIPRGFNYIFFWGGGLAVFLAGILGSDLTFQTLEEFLIRPYRLWKDLCSSYPNHTTNLPGP